MLPAYTRIPEKVAIEMHCILGTYDVAPVVLSFDYDAYDTPRPTQPFIPPGSVNEDQLRLGRKRQARFIPLADERGVCIYSIAVMCWQDVSLLARFV